MKWAWVVAIVLLLAVPVAEAGPPDPTQSSVDPWDTSGIVYVCPGTANSHDTVRVTVRDALGLACPSVPVTIDLSNCTNLCIDTPSGLTGTTDGSGVVVLNPRVGGCETCNVVVRSAGVVLRTYTQIISTDWDGSWADGIVNSADSVFFELHYPSPPKPYSVCVDYNFDGVVNIIDFTEFGFSWNNSNAVTCPKPPQILSIVDVANDQGRQVRITFTASALDTAGSATPILQYEAFRRIDPLPPAPTGPRSANSMDWQARVRLAQQAGLLSDYEVLMGGWDYVGSVPAHVETEYNMIAATLADSTISNGMHWSVFFIRAATASPATFFDSPVDSGYSLDNLAPATPQGLSVAYNSGHSNLLDWEPAPEPDFQYFKIYRSTDPDFIPAPQHLVHTTIDNSWLDTAEQAWRYSYKISAVDFSGNESPPASASSATSIEDQSPLPEEFALYQNVPNPFNPTTSIRFDVPAGGGHVTVNVYDVKGRLVRTLVNGPQSSGHKSVTWNGLDSAGREVASGVYFCRLTAPSYEMTRKMVLLE